MSPVPVRAPDPVRARPPARVRPAVERPLRTLQPVPLRPVQDRSTADHGRHRRVVVLGVAAAMVFVLSLLGMAGFHAFLLTGQVRLDELQAKVAVEQNRYSSLRLEVAQLQAPGHVVRAAAKLGMVPPAGGPTYLAPTDALADEVAAAAGDPAPPDEGAASAVAAQAWETVKPYLGSGE